MASPNTAAEAKYTLTDSSDGLRIVLPTLTDSSDGLRMAFPHTAAEAKYSLTNSSDGLRVALHTLTDSSNGLRIAHQMHLKKSVSESHSSPPAQAESSSVRNHPPYDVFISHCGRDTKHTLASTIYNKLDSTGLRVFLDKNELKLGDFFPQVLEEAIAKASLHIAIFSKNYAHSRWCLDELESMLQTNAIFFPTFYHIEPSVLRWVNEGRGSYADAFRKYEEKKRYSIKKLESWKSALNKASLYTGQIIDNQCDEEEAAMNVVSCVLKELKKMRLDVAQHPVGLDEAEQEFHNIALQSMGPIQIVGIWGMGGAGKTTLAKHLYNKKCSTIKKSTFLFDVREAAFRGKLHEKQKKLLEDLGLKVATANFDNIDEGKGILSTRLRSVPVLIVLDDVDHKDQLDALVPARDNLGQGSLIIVTTRELHVLKQWNVSAIYKIKTLDASNANELFCWNAFGQPSPLKDFKELANKFTNACCGLPLSLKVIGSSLHGELSKEYWESQLHKLLRIVPEDIKAKLKISYDALDNEEKEMFLDAACFYIGWPKSRAIAIWDGSEWSGLHGWHRLVNKCLIEIEEDNTIKMHDHLRDLGREIANKQSPYRLWSNRQIIEIQPQQQAIQIRGMADAIGDINCHLRDGEMRLQTSQGERILTPGSFGLKILIGKGDFIDEECSELSRELLYFRCYSFPHKNIPSWFPLKNLRSLELHGAQKLEDLWECDENAPLQLRQLVISGGYSLEKLSVLQRLSSLEELVIKDCTELKTLPSLAGLTSLKQIDLDYCRVLKKIEGLECLRSLETFNIDSCRKVKTLAGLAGLTSLKQIVLGHCPELEKIKGLECLRSLETFNIYHCIKLKTLPGLAGLTSLKQIYLRECSELENIEGLECLRSLETFNIYRCLNLKTIRNLTGLTSLKEIYIACCHQLEKMEGLEGLRSLETLSIQCCGELKTLPRLGELTSLQKFLLKDCMKVEKVEDLEVLSSLKKVEVHMCSTRPCMLKLPEQSERLKSVEVVARRVGMVEPSTREMQKWARKEIICTMGVIDVGKLLTSDCMLPEDVLHTYSSYDGLQRRRLRMPESDGNGNAILICTVVHSFHSHIFYFSIRGIESGIESRMPKIFSTTMENSAGESIWVWMGIFPQQSRWLSSQEYTIAVEVEEEEGEGGVEVEVKEGWLMRGREQSIREVFHHLITES